MYGSPGLGVIPEILAKRSTTRKHAAESKLVLFTRGREIPLVAGCKMPHTKIETGL